MRALVVLMLGLAACAPAVGADAPRSAASAEAVQEEPFERSATGVVKHAGEAGARIKVILDDFVPVDVKVRPGAESGFEELCELAAESESDILEQTPECAPEE